MRVDPGLFLRTAAALFLATAPSLLFAQGKDMGPAGQYYNQPKPKFHVTPGVKKTGGDVTWSTAPGGRQEVVRDEYLILEKEVVIKYQDIVIHADKVTANLKTKDVVAEGHVILDQGPTRITGEHIVFNLDSKTGTFFNATGSLHPDMYFVGEKIERLAEDRYRPSENVKHGDLNAYAVHDPETGRNEWRYNYQHSQNNLPGGFRGVVDVEDISNLEFFRRFSHDPRLHTLSQIYSSAYLTKNRSTYSFNILTDRRDRLLGNVDPNDPLKPPSRQRFEQLPSLQFRRYPNRGAGSPLCYSME